MKTPFLPAIVSLLYDNLGLFHLWPVFQGSIDEAHSARNSATHSRHGDTVSRPEGNCWQALIRFSGNLYYGVVFFSSLSLYLGTLLIAASTPVANLGGTAVIVIASDSFLVGTIIFAFTQCLGNGRRRWPASSRVQLAKVFAEQMACFVRVSIAFLTCFAFAQVRSSTSVITLPLSRTLPRDIPSAEQPSHAWWHFTVLAILLALVLMHLIYVILTVSQLSSSTIVTSRRNSDIALESQGPPIPARYDVTRRHRRPRTSSTLDSNVTYATRVPGSRVAHEPEVRHARRNPPSSASESGTPDEDGPATTDDDGASSVFSTAGSNDTSTISEASLEAEVEDGSHDPVATS